MSYIITQADLESITDVELIWGTVRLLPAWSELQEWVLRDEYAMYEHIVISLFNDKIIPEYRIVFNPGFSFEKTQAHLIRCVQAHLRSFQPKHEHKIAGVAFMISKVCSLEKIKLSNMP